MSHSFLVCGKNIGIFRLHSLLNLFCFHFLPSKRPYTLLITGIIIGLLRVFLYR